MANGLPKRAMTGMYDEVMVNVYCLETKKIVFHGNAGDVSNFLGIGRGSVIRYVNTKNRFRKKYALRRAKATGGQ